MHVVLVCLGQHSTKQLPVQCRNSHQSCSVKKGVLKNFAIFTRKHLCWSIFLIKLQAISSATLLKTNSNRGVFLWILQNFRRTPILKNICKWLLLAMSPHSPQSSQCCPNVSETTLHKELLVQCWPRPHSYLFAGKYSSAWANIALEKYLYNVGPQSTNNFAQKNNLQCCLDLCGQTLHKEISCAMLVHS